MKKQESYLLFRSKL